MLSDQVVAFPTDATLQYLGEVMQGSPIEFDDPSSWHVNIFLSTVALDPDSIDDEAVYRAIPKVVDYWYDSQIQMTNLVLVMESPDLMARHKEFLEAGINSKFDRYVPNMMLKFGMPALSRANRSFVLSLSDSFHADSFALTFGAESLVHSQGLVPNLDGQNFHAQRTGVDGASHP